MWSLVRPALLFLLSSHDLVLTLLDLWLDTQQEKYKVVPPSTIAAGPPKSLLSLPVELLSLIFNILDKEDHLALCLVSFRLLEFASKSIYRDGLIFLDPDEAYSLVEARVSSFDFIFSLTMRLPSRPLTLLQLQLQLPSHRFSAPLPHPIGFVTSFFPS